MSNGIEEAASAFQAELDGDDSPNDVRSNEEVKRDKPTESLFNNLEYDGSDDDAGIEENDPEPVKQARVDKKIPEADDDFFNVKTAPDAGDGDEENEEAAEDESPKVIDLSALPLKAKVTVNVDGQPVEMELGEAINGGIRMETFHRRMSQVAEVKRAVLDEGRKVVEQRQEYMTRLGELVQFAETMVPKEPNWDEEFAKNPVAARELEKQYNQFKQFIEGFKQERARVATEQQQEDQGRTAEYARENFHGFIADNPEFNSEPRVAAAMQRMYQTAEKLGFSHEEISTVYDRRMLNVLYKAAQWDHLQSVKDKQVARIKPRTMAPGAGSNRTAPKGMDRALQRLRRSGSVDDAASVFERMLK